MTGSSGERGRDGCVEISWEVTFLTVKEVRVWGSRFLAEKKPFGSRDGRFGVRLVGWGRAGSLNGWAWGASGWTTRPGPEVSGQCRAGCTAGTGRPRVPRSGVWYQVGSAEGWKAGPRLASWDGLWEQGGSEKWTKLPKRFPAGVAANLQPS